MQNDRRTFLKLSTLTGITLATGNVARAISDADTDKLIKLNTLKAGPQQQQSIIGQYGPWATGENSKSLPTHSFRNPKWKDHRKWQQEAKKVTLERMGMRDTGKMPAVTVKKQYEFDGLHIEELS